MERQKFHNVKGGASIKFGEYLHRGKCMHDYFTKLTDNRGTTGGEVITEILDFCLLGD